MSARIHVHIGELHVRGASPLEAQRLRDALAVALERGAPSLPLSSFRARASGGRVRARGRIEQCGAALAAAVWRSVQR